MKKKKGLNIFLLLIGTIGIIFSMKFLIPDNELAQVKSELDGIQAEATDLKIKATDKIEEVSSLFMKN